MLCGKWRPFFPDLNVLKIEGSCGLQVLANILQFSSHPPMLSVWGGDLKHCEILVNIWDSQVCSDQMQEHILKV